VSACRFEQGDILYSDASAYDTFSTDSPHGGRWVQILDPPKTARALTTEGEGNRFASSWLSPVELDLSKPPGGDVRRIATTQGRLFSCLWRGDVALLEPDGDDPPAPLLARDLHPRLCEVVPALRRALGGGDDDDRRLLLMVLDRASDASRIKLRAVEAALAEAFSVDTLDLAPPDAGLDGAEAFHPALVVRCLAIAGAEAEQVEARVKAVLYSPVEGKADRFSISRHGHLAD
jgi:hypothetical protein